MWSRHKKQNADKSNIGCVVKLEQLDSRRDLESVLFEQHASKNTILTDSTENQTGPAVTQNT